MNCNSKDKLERNEYNNICKSHSARSDRELYRICPSKLSKRELEDLYFSLLENNLDLKRTINTQLDKIKGLSTKVQRMTAVQKNIQSKETKDCCIGTKTVVTEQRESITELKRSNQRMAERIQMLNMRLCSAKQFFKKPQPHTSSVRCNRCAPIQSPPKSIEKAGVEVPKLSTSMQCDESCLSSAKQAETGTETQDLDRPPSDQPCDENKCRTLMEELKMKVVNLQEELCNVHGEYSTRISRLEGEVCDVRRENLRALADRAASEHELHTVNKKTHDILADLRDAEAKCAELTTQLNIERRRIVELETQLRAAGMSGRISKTIEAHLTTMNDVVCDACECSTERKVSTKQPVPRTRSDKRSSTEQNIKDVVSDACDCSTQRKVSTTQPVLQTRSDKRSSTEQNIKDVVSDACDCSTQRKVSTTQPVLQTGSDKRSSTEQNIKDKVCDACECSIERKVSTTQPVPQTGSDKRSSTEQHIKVDKCVECACHLPEKEPCPTPFKDIFTFPKSKELRTCICGCHPPQGSSTPAKDSENIDCVCPPWKEIDLTKSPILQDIETHVCACQATQETPLPTEAKSDVDKKNIECQCPPWHEFDLPGSPLSKSQDAHAKCLKCCYKEQEGTMSEPSSVSPPDRPKVADKEWSPTQQRVDAMASKDDSGYQEAVKTPTDDMQVDHSMVVETKLSPKKLSDEPKTTEDTSDFQDATKNLTYDQAARPIIADPKLSPTKLNDEPKTTKDTSGSPDAIKSAINEQAEYPKVADTKLSPKKLPEEPKSPKDGSAYPDATKSPHDQVDRPKVTDPKLSPTRLPEEPKASKGVSVYPDAIKSQKTDDSVNRPKEVEPKLSPKKLHDDAKTDTTGSVHPDDIRSQKADDTVDRLKVPDAKSSPTKLYDDAKTPKDDSGYQDATKSPTTDDGLRKLNKELMAKILDLQSQLDALRIAGMSELPKQTKLTESSPTQMHSVYERDGRPVIETDKKMPMRKGSEHDLHNLDVTVSEFMPASPPTKMAPRKARISEETRAKTIDPHGNIHLTDIRTSAMPEDIVDQSDKQTINTDLDGKAQTPEKVDVALGTDRKEDRDLNKSVPEPLKIRAVEETSKNVELSKASKAQEPTKPEIIPEKLKASDIKDDTAPQKTTLMDRVESETSITALGSIPSNPELGFRIPKIEEKAKRDKNKSDLNVAEKLSGVSEQNKERSVDDNMEMLPGKLKLPMTEALVASKGTKSKDETSTKKELCEYCASCSYDRECATKFYKNPNDLTIATVASVTKKEQVPKPDYHNSLQIPGPIASDTNHKKKHLFKHFSFDKKKEKVKEKVENAKKESVGKHELSVVDTKTVAARTSVTTTGPINLADVPLIQKPEEETMVEVKTGFAQTKDSRLVHHRRISASQESKINEYPAHVDVEIHNLFTQNGRMVSILPQCKEETAQAEQKSEVVQKSSQSYQEKGSQVSSKTGDSWRSRNISMYRRNSGTLCFRTLPVRDDPRYCHCPDRQDGRCLLKPKDKGVQVEGGEDKLHQEQSRASSSVTEGTKQSRATSPDNTDNEISYMSDLPSEKEKKCPDKRRALSPGEDKMTSTTYSEENSRATNMSLSEGELPPTGRKLVSNGQEKKQYDQQDQLASAQKMEKALQAITDELTRCKTLINSQRPQEKPCQDSHQSQTSATDVSRPIALRQGVARQAIGDAYSPKGIFTLHIGTVVLSDEAVINSRGKSFVLTWKFYDQTTTMTHMRAGRVVLFDFSTEYDIKLTDDFLQYMKHEEMPIYICELDKYDKPFASCTLPLREALLHTNSRADMSLALVAGPQMVVAREKVGATDQLDARDEMGVLDLWCMLRADAAMLPNINLAITQPVETLAEHRKSLGIAQMMEDDIDQELARPLVGLPPPPRNITRDMEGLRNHVNNTKVRVAETDAHTQTSSTNKTDATLDLNQYPPIRSRRESMYGFMPLEDSDVTRDDEDSKPLRPGPALPQSRGSAARFDTTYDSPERDSDIIVNEVSAKIKSPEDLKRALEESYLQDIEYGRSHKVDEEITPQAHASIGSLRNVLARLHRKSSKSKTDSGASNLVARRSSLNPERFPSPKDMSDMEIYRKYENIGKLIGSSRTEQSKKSVKILPTCLRSSSIDKDVSVGTIEEQRRVQKLDITILWLALNEECEAMIDPKVQRVYVAYSFLGRTGADLETPVSLPKPKHYVDKCYFNFKKTFELEDPDLYKLSHMARCRASSKMSEDENDCIIFSVISEPAEDPLGLENCEDIGYAYLYLGDLVAYSAGSAGYTEVLPVRAARRQAGVCGVLAVRLDGLDVVRRCLLLPSSVRSSDWQH